MRTTVGVTLLVLATIPLGLALAAVPQEPSPASGWWKQQKLRVMWGQWDLSREDKTRPYRWAEILPRDLFRNLAQAGGNAFIASREDTATNTG
jgi:hypothetical protein